MVEKVEQHQAGGDNGMKGREFVLGLSGLGQTLAGGINEDSVVAGGTDGIRPNHRFQQQRADVVGALRLVGISARLIILFKTVFNKKTYPQYRGILRHPFSHHSELSAVRTDTIRTEAT